MLRRLAVNRVVRALTCAGLLATAVFTTAERARASGATTCFTSAGVDGGGFTNVVAVDPLNPGVVLAGGDGSGVDRSTDWGATWAASNAGLPPATGYFDKNYFYVHAIAFSATYSGRAYLVSAGGVFLSADGGRTWQPAGVPGAAAVNAPTGRFTGNLVAIDPDATRANPAATVREVVYVGTAGGVYRSNDGGVSWVLIADKQVNPLNLKNATIDVPRDITSLALDSASNTLYAASSQTNAGPDSSYAGYVYALPTASTAPSGGLTPRYQKLVNSPVDAQEILFLNGAVYAAGIAGVQGWYASSGVGGPWGTLTTSSAVSDTPAWESLASYTPAGGNPVLLAGGGLPLRGHPPGGNTTYANIVAFTAAASPPSPSATPADRWSSATSLVTGSGHVVHTTEFNPSSPATGAPWWLNGGGYGLNEPAEVPTSIVTGTEPNGALHIMVGARGGAWTSVDAGANWYPAMHGLGVTVANAVATDPQRPQRVYTTLADWMGTYSDDAMASVTSMAGWLPVSGNSGRSGYQLALDASAATGTSRVYVGVGSNGVNANGEVDYDPSGGAWSPATGYGPASGGTDPAGGLLPLGTAVNTVQGTKYLMVSANGVGRSGPGGVFVKNLTSGTWTSWQAPAGTKISAGVSLSWPAGQDTAYLYDNLTGVWRSTDRGQSWSNIWSITEAVNTQQGSVVASPDGMTAYVAVPENIPKMTDTQSKVATGLYRLDNAGTPLSTVGNPLPALAITPTLLKAVSRPGPLAWGADPTATPRPLYFAHVGSGTLANGVQGLIPDIVVSTNYTNSSSTWSSVIDAAHDHGTYAGAAFLPTGLSVGTDGSIYVSLYGNGVLHSKPCTS